MSDAVVGRERLVRGGSAMVVGSIAQKALGLVQTVIVVRALPVDRFGAYSFAMAYALFVATLSDVGVDTVLTRRLARADGADSGVVLASGMVVKTVMVAASLVIATVATLLYDIDLRVPAIVGVATIIGTIPSTLALVDMARLRPAAPMVIRTAGSILALAAVAIAALAGASVLVLVAVQTTTAIATGIALWVRTARRHPIALRFDRAEARSVLVEALPVGLATLAVVIFARVDQLLLGAMSTVRELARYGVAVRVVEAFNFVPTAIGAIALPALAHLDTFDPARARRLVRTGFRYLAVAVLPLAALVTVSGGDLLAEVFGSPYRAAAPSLTLLFWANYFVFAWVLARQVLVAGRQGRSLAILAWVAAVVNVALNIVLIPSFGAKGSAAASLIAYAAPFVGSLLLASSRPVFGTAVIAALRPAVAAAVVLGAVWVASQLTNNLACQLLAFAVSAPAAVILTRSLTVRELRGFAGGLRRADAPLEQDVVGEEIRNDGQQAAVDPAAATGEVLP